MTTLPEHETPAEALARFDGLPTVDTAELRGRWAGSGLATGHPLDGLLELAGWYGKSFTSDDDVQPLLFRDARGIYPINAALVPMTTIARHPGWFQRPTAARLFQRIGRLARSRSPGARLRMTAYRGAVSATMIYDRLPVCDVFRRVDADTLLGAMDLRDVPQPFFFVLRRD